MRAAPTIGILVYEGVDEVDFISAYGVLKKARDYRPMAPLIDAVLLGPPRALTASAGLAFTPQDMYARLGACAALVVPGGRGAADLASDDECCARILEFIAAGKPVYSICSGALFLARIGVLRATKVAIHHNKATQLPVGARCVAARGLVRDGWLTSIGGDRAAPYVKGVEIAYRILEDFCPEVIAYVVRRLECAPHYSEALVE